MIKVIFSMPGEYNESNDQLESECVGFKESSIERGGRESVMHVGYWIPTFEPLAPSFVKPVFFEEKSPISERKPLPFILKYAFLGEGVSYPVVNHLAYLRAKRSLC